MTAIVTIETPTLGDTQVLPIASVLAAHGRQVATGPARAGAVSSTGTD